MNNPTVTELLMLTAQQNLQFSVEVVRLRETLLIYADPWAYRNQFGEAVSVPDFYSEMDFGSYAEESISQPMLPLSNLLKLAGEAVKLEQLKTYLYKDVDDYWNDGKTYQMEQQRNKVLDIVGVLSPAEKEIALKAL